MLLWRNSNSERLLYTYEMKHVFKFLSTAGCCSAISSMWNVKKSEDNKTKRQHRQERKNVHHNKTHIIFQTTQNVNISCFSLLVVILFYFHSVYIPTEELWRLEGSYSIKCFRLTAFSELMNIKKMRKSAFGRDTNFAPRLLTLLNQKKKHRKIFSLSPQHTQHSHFSSH